MRCRLCFSSVHSFLSLGSVPLPEEFRDKQDANLPVKTYPLGLSFCLSCGHIQLTSPVSPDVIYKKHYFYDYSVTRTGLLHWNELSEVIASTRNLGPDDLVVDIGSNTGVLLSLMRKRGIRIIGVDPAERLVAIARANGIPTVNDYFSRRVAERIVEAHGTASVITCTNVFDHLEILDEFMQGIGVLLSNDGICIIEVPYFGLFLKNLSHVVYHQQIDYMMVKPLIPFFLRYGMCVVDAELVSMHGGSVRLWVKKGEKGNQAEALRRLVSEETNYFRRWEKFLDQFAHDVYTQRDMLRSYVLSGKRKGKVIAGVGASAKGITLLNYSGLDGSTVSFITEKSPLKVGRFTPSGIPVTGDEELFNRQPDIAVMLAWNFAGEIRKNLSAYKGTCIIPVPHLKEISTARRVRNPGEA